MTNAYGVLNDFYGLLEELTKKDGQGKPLWDVMTSASLPKEGVYFFFEPGELRPGAGKQPRVVRVGTHGVSAGSKSTLRSRLRAHAGTAAGGGNHRGSIFRLHVGSALLQRSERSLASWGRGSSMPLDVRADPAAREAESTWEQEVSAYIRSMPVMWVGVPGTSAASNRRAYLESNSIALLSNGMSPLEPASKTWLGAQSPNEVIRRSALWNLRSVAGQCDSRFLKQLESAVRGT